jgi:hypothetical protein
VKKNKALALEILAAADDYLKTKEIQPLDFRGYTAYLANGNRLQFENDYFERRRQLAVMGLACRLAPANQAYQDFLEEVIWAVCNEYTWALPAHLPIKNQQFTKESVATIDLFAAETSATLSEIQQFMRAKFPAVINNRIILEINRRIFNPLKEKTWGWETKDNNWSAVIAGSIGITAIIQLQKRPVEQQAIIKRLDIAMNSFLASYAADGACVEGVSYWAYGFGYYAYYAEMLARELGDTKYLKKAKVAEIAKFPYYAEIGNNQFVPFSDYAKTNLPDGLMNYCNNKLHAPIPITNQVTHLDDDTCYRFAHLLRDLIWDDNEVQNSAALAHNHEFHDAQWLILNQAPSRFVFCAKGGHNAESHNHIDVGNFILGDGEQFYLTDLGSGEYTKEYFRDETRYDYFVTSTLSHSVPIINGQSQTPGKFPARIVKSDIQMPVTDWALDLTAAYPEVAALQTVERHFVVNQDQRMVEIHDYFAFNEMNNRVKENFVTQVKPIVEGKRVRLANCTIQFESADIQVVKQQFNNHEGVEESAYLIQVDYPIAKSATIHTIFSLN